jgi:hypothetical protein
MTSAWVDPWEECSTVHPGLPFFALCEARGTPGYSQSMLNIRVMNKEPLNIEQEISNV